MALKDEAVSLEMIQCEICVTLLGYCLSSSCRWYDSYLKFAISMVVLVGASGRGHFGLYVLGTDGWMEKMEHSLENLLELQVSRSVLIRDRIEYNTLPLPILY